MGRFGLLLLLLLLAPASGARGRGLPWRPMTLPSPGGDRTINEELEDIPEDIPGDISEEDELDDTPPPLPPLPPHEFLKREHTWTTGAKKGETSVFVTLSAPPYQFTRKTNKQGDGTLTFICKECRQMGKIVSCQVFKTTNEDNEALDRYDIFEETWPLAEDHMCAPSGFNKHIAQCKKSILDAIKANPSQPMPALYNLMRSHYTKPLQTRYCWFLLSVPCSFYLFLAPFFCSWHLLSVSGSFYLFFAPFFLFLALLRCSWLL